MKQTTTYLTILLLIISSVSFSQSPNIIVIIADDMGWSQVSTGLTNLNNPSDFYETPTLATLAAEGIAFPYGYTNGANCAPTRAAMLSGQYPSRPTNNIFAVDNLNRGGNSTLLVGPANGLPSGIDELPVAAITLAETMKTAGYTTVHLGKYHVGENESTNNTNNAATDQGFDSNYGGGTKGNPGNYFASESGGNWTFHANIGPELDPYADPYTAAESIALSVNGDNALEGTPKHVTDAMADAAIDFMDANSNTPFFMHFSNFAIHGPFNQANARPDLYAKYDAKPPSAMGHNSKGQAAIAEGMDQTIGRLIDYLKTTPDPRNPGFMLSENTLVYFLSDNGGAIGTDDAGPLRGMKGEYYEGGIRSVTLAWSEASWFANAGTVNTTPVIGFDLYPTFVDMAGGSLPVGYDIDGVSLWPLINGSNPNLGRDVIVWHFPGYLIDSKRDQRPVTVVRKGDYKLIHNYETASYELYNLVTDISETTNLLINADQATVDIANDMIDDMRDHLINKSSPLPTYRSDGTTVPLPDYITLTNNSQNGCQPTSGFEAFWDFDTVSDANDASSNGHDPVAVNGTPTYDLIDFVEGDQSIVFDGSTNIQYSSGAFLTAATSSRTAMAWIKPSALSGIQNILDEGGGTRGIGLRLNGTNLESVVRESGSSANQMATAFPNDSEWHHVALVYDGTNSIQRIYIDGVEVVNGAAPAYIASHTGLGGIAGKLSGIDSFGNTTDVNFTGKMDAFVIYESVLSAAQIEESACSALVNSTDGCQPTVGFEAFYDFDKVHSQITNDASGNSHNAQSVTGTISADDVDFMEGDQSAVFDGNTEVEYDDGTFLNAATNYRSVAVWIKPTSLVGAQEIFEEGGTGNGMALRLNDDKIEAAVTSNTESSISISEDYPGVANEWHHVVVVFEGNTKLAIYVDGVETAITTSGVPNQLNSHSSPGGIGGVIGGGDSFGSGADTSFFTGKMDALAIYDTALSLSDIESMITYWYADTDGDGYGDINTSIIQCTQPSGYVSNNTDCDDSLAAINPGATEVADGIDNNCNSGTDEGATFTFSDSWSPMDPNGFITDAEFIVSSGDAVISTNTSCSSLTVDPGASLTINSGVNMILYDVVNGLTLESTSSSYSSLILNGTVTGTINYERHVNAYTSDGIANDNDLVSPPLSGQTLSDFVTENSGLLLSQGSNPTIYALAPFNNNTGNYENFDSNTVSQLSPGTGYRIATTAPNTNLKFTGLPLIGNQTIEIPVGIDGTYGSWNLIGNPYPAYIDFDSFHAQLIADDVLEDGFVAIYGYDGDASDGWTIWDGNFRGNLIAPGQGFFVKTKASLSGANPAPEITFTPAMRTVGSTDDFISGAPSSIITKATINLNKGTDSYHTNLFFHDSGTRNLDYGYDSAVYESQAYNIFTNLVEGNIGLELFNQALPTTDYNDVVVPLGVYANSGEQITISLDNSTTVPGDIYVYLEDVIENSWTLLNNTDYISTLTNEINGVGRYFLHFQTETLSNPDINSNNISIFTPSDSKNLIVKGLLPAETQLHIYDVQGRLVLKETLAALSAIRRINVENLNTGVYVVKVNNPRQSKTQKIIIN